MNRYALTALLPVIGFARTSAIVAGICVLGLLITVTLLGVTLGSGISDREDFSVSPDYQRSWK